VLGHAIRTKTDDTGSRYRTSETHLPRSHGLLGAK